MRIGVAAAMMWAVMASSQSAMAQKGESTFGVFGGYTSTNESAVAGLFYQYNLTAGLRIAPQASCVFRHQNLDAFQADVNLHFPLRFTPDRAQLYPIAGLNFSSWTTHNVADDIDATNRRSRLGGNVGAGFQLKATPTLKIKIEGVYTLIKQYSSFSATVGIGYIF